MAEKKQKGIKCYECHFRCYCGKTKQEQAMERGSCPEYRYYKYDMGGFSSWGNYFREPGY
ncbi:MAG: hypothetical protein LIO75_04760 [Lachnospiraceae bacterium]|nr:hypothetical protein [Lachnospiraceae bacterium]